MSANDEGSSYSSSSPEDSFRDSELDDVPMWLPEDTHSDGGASTRRPAPQLSSLGLLGRSQGSNDGSATARGAPPGMGKLQLGSLSTSRAECRTAPAFPQRERGENQLQPDEAATISSAHQHQHEKQRGRVSDSSINDSSLLPSSTVDAKQRTAIPSLSLGGLRPPAPSTQEAHAQPAASTSQATSSSPSIGPSQSVAVSLLSYAFVTSTPAPQDSSPSDSMSALLDGITQRIACQLGVRTQDLRLFSLTELDGSQPSSSSSSSSSKGHEEPQHHVAALVKNSGFSMAALEEMLTWNQQLQSMQSTHAQTIATMHQDFKDATSENKQLVLQVAAKDHELARLEEQNQKKNAEMESMRLAMQQGEEQRQQLVSVISMLKQEFLSLRSVIGGEAQ